MTCQNTQEWATKHFGCAQLFNKKKVKRLLGIATRLAEAKAGHRKLERFFE